MDEIIIHMGGQPQKPVNDNNAIYAGFTADEPPPGFTIVQRLEFGQDVSLRLRKTSDGIS